MAPTIYQRTWWQFCYRCNTSLPTLSMLSFVFFFFPFFLLFYPTLLQHYISIRFWLRSWSRGCQPPETEGWIRWRHARKVVNLQCQSRPSRNQQEVRSFCETAAFPWSGSPAETPRDFSLRDPYRQNGRYLYISFSWQVHVASPWAQPTGMKILSHPSLALSETISVPKNALHPKKLLLLSPVMRRTALRTVRHCTCMLKRWKWRKTIGLAHQGCSFGNGQVCGGSEGCLGCL